MLTKRRGRPKLPDRISIDNAIVQVGKLLLGGAWIDKRSKREQDLLRQYAARPDECPKSYRGSLRLALKRHVKLQHQYSTAYEWLLHNGPRCVFSYYDRLALKEKQKSLREERARLNGACGPGRPPIAREQAMKKMREDVRKGKFTKAEILARPKRALTRWGSPNTADEARRFLFPN
jgi:hypothetical protein